MMDLHAPGQQSRTRTPGSWFPGCMCCDSSPVGLTVSLKQKSKLRAENTSAISSVLCQGLVAALLAQLSLLWHLDFLLAGCHLLESSSLPFSWKSFPRLPLCCVSLALSRPKGGCLAGVGLPWIHG